MKDFIKNNILLGSVFITGACILIVEIVAVRVLSPYYGNTIFTVSSVISVILAALSLGYYFGGKFSDRHPKIEWFYGIITISAVLLLSFHFISILILPILSLLFSITIGPLVSAILLFFLPAFLLGTLSPYAVKLQSVQTPDQGVGSISGKIFFWSTLGSITGSLSAGFILIPTFGLNNIFIFTSLFLFLLGIIPMIYFGNLGRWLKIILVLFIATVIVMLIALNNVHGQALYEKDGVYEKITIFEGYFDGRPTRFFRQDKSSSGAMFLDEARPTDMTYEYSKYYSLYKLYESDIRAALVIGGGVYSIPRALMYELPDARIDVSEIEPSLFELAQKYFNLRDTENLNNFVEDGRRFLRDSDTNYDLIFSDVYYSLFSIPSHFTTKEFFDLAKTKMTDNGVIIINLIGDLNTEGPSFIFSEIKTFLSVFPNARFFAVTGTNHEGLQNIIMVGPKGQHEKTVSSIDQNNLGIDDLAEKEIDISKYDLDPYQILTDDFAPVEYLTKSMIERSRE